MSSVVPNRGVCTSRPILYGSVTVVSLQVSPYGFPDVKTRVHLGSHPPGPRDVSRTKRRVSDALDCTLVGETRCARLLSWSHGPTSGASDVGVTYRSRPHFSYELFVTRLLTYLLTS